MVEFLKGVEEHSFDERLVRGDARPAADVFAVIMFVLFQKLDFIVKIRYLDAVD